MTGGLISVLITSLTLFFAYSAGVYGFNYGKSVGGSMTREKPSREVKIELDSSATIGEVASMLHEKGVIDNELIFKIDCYIKGYGDVFPEGSYTVNANMDDNEILAALRPEKNADADIKIIMLEGYSIANMTSYLAEKGVVSEEEFREALESEYNYAFLEKTPKRENRLEGYLFPDTYFVSPKGGAQSVIRKMLDRFEVIYDVERARRAEEIGLSVDDSIIIASIIEKETLAQETEEKTAELRAKISAVIHNRLKKGMPLEMPSTVSYFSDKRADMLKDELSDDSPYNTFLYPGLPKGPICNPGEASLKAALYPDESAEYLYMKSDFKAKTIRFVKTKEELENEEEETKAD